MARGGNKHSSTPLDSESLAPAPIVQPLASPSALAHDLYGDRLDLYGVVLLDEIGSKSTDFNARQAMWNDLAQAFPGGVQTLGDMFIHFWDDPAIVQSLREYAAGLPFRMVVACGYQSEHQAPLESLSIYRNASLGLMAFGAEYEVKLQERSALWSGSEGLSTALENQDSSWLTDFSVDKHELVKHANIAEIARALVVADSDDPIDEPDVKLAKKYLKRQAPEVAEQARTYLTRLSSAREQYAAVKAARAQVQG